MEAGTFPELIPVAVVAPAECSGSYFCTTALSGAGQLRVGLPSINTIFLIALIIP